MELFSDFVSSHSDTVNFLLFFLFFGGVARIAFTRHFGERAASKIAVPVGLILATGLLLGQERLGFQLESLGLVAVFLITFALTIAAFRLMTFSGLSAGQSAGMAFVFLVITLRVLAPVATGAWLAKHGDLVVVGILIGALVAYLSSKRAANSWQESLNAQALARLNAIPNRETLNRILKSLRATTSVVQRNTAQLKNHAKAMGRRLTRSRMPSLSNDDSHTRLRALQDEADNLLVAIDRMKKLDAALAEGDLAWLERATGLRTSQFSESQKRTLSNVLRLERERLKLESKTAEQETRVAQHVSRLSTSISEVRKLLSRGHETQAQSLMKQVIAESQETTKLQARVLWLERVLTDVFRKQFALMSG